MKDSEKVRSHIQGARKIYQKLIREKEILDKKIIGVSDHLWNLEQGLAAAEIRESETINEDK